MGAIAAGVLAALLSARRGVLPRQARRGLAVIGSLALVLVMFAGGWLWKGIHEGYMLVLIGAAVCLVLAVPEGGQALRARMLKPARVAATA